MAETNQFLDTVLNRPNDIKKFLVEQGMRGKSTAPISFFAEEDKERFVRQSEGGEDYE